MLIRLTQKIIENPPACPVDKAKLELCDAAFPGLRYEVRSTNTDWGTFFLRYKNNAGKTCHRKLGRSTEITLKQAREAAKTLKSQIQLNGVDPQAEVKRSRSTLAVREYATDHFIPWTKVRKRSWRNDQSMLNLRILPALGDIRLDRVTRHQIETLHNSLLEEGLSGAHADHHLKCIRFMYTKAIEQGFCKSNPASSIKQFNIDNQVERYLSDAELGRLLAVLEKDPNRPVANAILLLLSTGMRLNECLSAEWRNVDRASRTLTVEASRSKSKKRRIVILNDIALDTLNKLGTEGKHDQLFISSRTGKPLKSIRKAFVRIIEEAGIEGFRVHDLRHCFCSYALQQGRSLVEVSQLAGHSTVQMTMRYAHLAKGQLHDASNSAGDHIKAAQKANG